MKENTITIKGISDKIVTKLKELTNLKVVNQREIFEEAIEDIYQKTNIFYNPKKSLIEISRKNELGGQLLGSELAFVGHYNLLAYQRANAIYDKDKLIKIKTAIRDCFQSTVVDFKNELYYFAGNLNSFKGKTLFEKMDDSLLSNKENQDLIMRNLSVLCKKFGDVAYVNKELNKIANLLIENSKWYLTNYTDYFSKEKSNDEFINSISYSSKNKEFEFTIYSLEVAIVVFKNTVVVVREWKNILELLNIFFLLDFEGIYKGDYFEYISSRERRMGTLTFSNIKILFNEDDFQNIQNFYKTIKQDNKYLEFEENSRKFYGYPM